MSNSLPKETSPAEVLRKQGWWGGGAHVLFDGQYGSTGKGLLAAYIAHTCAEDLRGAIITTNAGPNSGHVSYFGTDKIILKQLPTAGVHLRRLAIPHMCYINPGAIVDPATLIAEATEHYPLLDSGYRTVSVHRHAAIIAAGDREANVAAGIASTAMGVVEASIRKMTRATEGLRVAKNMHTQFNEAGIVVTDGGPELQIGHTCSNYFIETPQGYSLGINSGFYPHCTSRECTPAQALADLGVPPQLFLGSIASLRTFPIRVGSTNEGSSGPCYSDQKEITWGEVGVEPELTTVTKRVRRVFTWSDEQFVWMLRQCAPTALFINFLNYLPTDEAQLEFVAHVAQVYRRTLGILPEFILGGFGPKVKDVRMMFPENIDCHRELEN